MEFYKEGESIEGERVAVYSRNIVPKVAKREVIGIVFVYKCNRNSSAEIIEEINITNSVWIDDMSNRSLNDKLRCEAIDLFHLGFKKKKIKSSEGASATHGAQYMDTDTRTYAKILHPFDCLAQTFKQQGLISEKKISEISKESD